MNQSVKFGKTHSSVEHFKTFFGQNWPI